MPAFSRELAAAAPDLHAVAGEPVRDVLLRAREHGLNVVFSSRLVPNRLRVVSPVAENASIQAQLQAVLAPYNLSLQAGESGTVYVVRERAMHAKGRITQAHPTTGAETGAEETVEEIIATAYRVQRNDHLSHALERQELQSLPALGRDTLRAVNSLPGIADSGVGAQSRIRGGGPNEVLYRLDGTEVLEPFHLSAYQSLVSAFNPGIVESVDVYTGGFPVDLAGKLSGVVDVSLTEPVSAFEGAIDVNLLTASADARGRTDSASWLVASRHSVVHVALDQLEHDFGDPHFRDQVALWRQTIGVHEFSLGAFEVNDEIKLSDSEGSERGDSSNRYINLWLAAEFLHSDALTSRWRVDWRRLQQDREGSIDAPDFSVGTLEDERRFRALKLTNHWNLRVDAKNTLRAGWEIARHTGAFRSAIDASFGSLGVPVQGVTQTQRDLALSRSGEAMAGYAEWTTRPSNVLLVTLGVRYDGQDIDPVHVSEFSGRVRVDYQVSERLRLHADAGRYTQQQQLYEIELDDGLAELQPPQHADQITVGLSWSDDATSWLRADLFYRHIENPWTRFDNIYNPWVLLPELQADRYGVEADESMVRGVELAFRAVVTPRLSWYASYVLSTSWDRVANEWRPRPWHQRHALKAGIQYTGARWQFGASLQAHSGWPVTPRVLAGQSVEQQLYDGRLGDYAALDLHIGRRVQTGRGDLLFYLDVANATNRPNPGGFDYSGGERETRTLLPVVPVLGVTWQF